ISCDAWLEGLPLLCVDGGDFSDMILSCRCLLISIEKFLRFIAKYDLIFTRKLKNIKELNI
ncbi:MAG: hypothetical protein KGL95_12880, partial [Patescibacteria group bacterium]|nr:hypothetical protein [Patescibacteria group bacterium]